jgi:tetratricopeptide (TPR) repeat protein
MFLLLAIVFAVSFVILGVGSGSTGISQVLQNFFNGSSATGPSLSSLQKKTAADPKDAAAWLAYANKLQQKNQPDAAATALQTYTKLKPKDQNALLQLAGIYLQRAQDWENVYSDAAEQTQALSPTPVLSPKSTSKLGQAIGSLTNPISSAVSSQTSSQTSTDYSQVITYLSDREQVYEKLAKLTPNDATTQYSLAQAAQDASDFKTAIAGYQKFLKLAPSDSLAPTARSAIKQLKAQESASSSTTTNGG